MFAKHNEDVKALVGISKSPATFQKYEVTRKHLSDFIQYKYRISDISMNEITTILKKKLVSEKLDQARDVFLFSCFCNL